MQVHDFRHYHFSSIMKYNYNGHYEKKGLDIRITQEKKNRLTVCISDIDQLNERWFFYFNFNYCINESSVTFWQYSSILENENRRCIFNKSIWTHWFYCYYQLELHTHIVSVIAHRIHFPLFKTNNLHTFIIIF